MDSNYYGIIEMSLVFGIVLAWAVWELISLKRDKKKPDDKPEASSTKSDQ